MQPFNQVTGKAAPILAANIDTDVIMPKQFLKGIDRAGLDRGLFFDLRFLPSGAPNPDFILNQPGWQSAKFLVTGPNFGCGSSREHAVWAIQQYGFRTLIAPTVDRVLHHHGEARPGRDRSRDAQSSDGQPGPQLHGSLLRRYLAKAVRS